MILWSLCKSRNTKLLEGIDTTPSSIVKYAHNSLHEWRCMQRARQPNHGTHQEDLWVKPPHSTMKCNVDRALFNNNSITGFDICFRDSSGTLLNGLLKYSLHNSTAPEAEALGLLEAINFVVGQGMVCVIF